MITHLELGSGTLPGSTATLPRFQAGKVSALLLSLIHSATDAVIIVDAMYRIVLVNQEAEHLFGHRACDLLEQPLDMLLPSSAGGEQRRRISRVATSVGATGKRTHRGLKGMHADGTRLMLDARISRISVQDESFIALVLNEAKHRRTQFVERQPLSRLAELRRWAVSSQHANEVEKRRFSKKLYDDIGQRLSVLKLDLDWLESSLADTDQSFPTRVAQMQGLLDNVIAMTKNMASALRPPLLDDFGLLAAVEWMAANFQKKTAVTCEVESKGMGLKLDDPVESAVFRVIQEALTNIEKHAHASHAEIAFNHTGSQLNVMIRDDGIGMDHGSDRKPGCYGLIAMQERIFVLGGTINIENAQPHGVAIHVSIPVEPVSSFDSLPPAPTTRL